MRIFLTNEEKAVLQRILINCCKDGIALGSNEAVRHSQENIEVAKVVSDLLCDSIIYLEWDILNA